MQFLQQLNIQSQNQGTSTGNDWLKSLGDNINSFSPVDGKLIGGNNWCTRT